MWSRQPKLKSFDMANMEIESTSSYKENNSSPSSASSVLLISDKADGKTLEPRNVWPLTLNLISCFLFMMNSYIVEPSSAYYANALGSSDALSGVMIGAAPWFAFFSAVGYSYWTNVSYKKPIIFAGILMIVGNLMYANAYGYKSMELCLLGRSMTGLGAPRVINRRYVADATPFALRTAASAAFALATALGSALGPGAAIVLNLFEFEVTLPIFGKQIFNGMTGPGYFMALAWFLYTCTIICTFQEPNRSGLDELRAREAAEAQRGDNEEETSLVRRTSSDTLDVDTREADSSHLHTHGRWKDSITNRSINLISWFRLITKATMICMVVIFLKRAALEALVASTSVVTKNRYAWSIAQVGSLHLVNGIIVIPVSIMAGWLSVYYEDRYLALWLISITIAGLSIMIDMSDFFIHSSENYNQHHPLSVGPKRYVVGSLIAFSGIEACNPFVASLMSKVVPSALAAGTLNSGLLSTLVGTSGRATGDVLITIMGLASIRNLLNLLIVPSISMMLLCGILIRRNYSILAI